MKGRKRIIGGDNNGHKDGEKRGLKENVINLKMLIAKKY